MYTLLLSIIYLSFISLGLPDSLLRGGMAGDAAAVWSAPALGRGV
jgi:hypothetical protein